MTEEERQRRLAEMAGNAEVREEARWARQKRARDADAAEEQANAPAAAGASHAKTPAVSRSPPSERLPELSCRMPVLCCSGLNNGCCR